MNALAANNRQYYPALDGLRGLAILMVVVFHNFNFTNYFFFGWLGVDLFFVISGFLITEILLNTVDKPNFLRKFYWRRIVRIFPLYYLLLIICFGVLPYISSSLGSMKYYTDNQWWYWLYLQNWLYIIKPQNNNNFLIHLWSLAVEEQFYLIWPFVVLFVRNTKLLLVITFAVLLTIMVARTVIWIESSGGSLTSDWFLYTRIDGLCLGCSLALLRKTYPQLITNSIAIIVTCFAIMNFIFFFFNKENNFSFPYFAFVGFTTFASLFLLLVNEAISDPRGIVAKIFTIPVLKFFGTISYGLYIIHWPLYKLLMPGLTSFFKKNEISSLAANATSACIATLLAVILSVLSHQYFEKRFLSLKEKF